MSISSLFSGVTSNQDCIQSREINLTFDKNLSEAQKTHNTIVKVTARRISKNLKSMSNLSIGELHGVLKISLSGLDQVELIGQNDSYIKVFLGESKIYTSEVIKKSNPVFEHFEVSLDPLVADLGSISELVEDKSTSEDFKNRKNARFRVEVWDKNKTLSDVFLGESIISLRPLLKSAKQKNIMQSRYTSIMGTKKDEKKEPYHRGNLNLEVFSSTAQIKQPNSKPESIAKQNQMKEILWFGPAQLEKGTHHVQGLLRKGLSKVLGKKERDLYICKNVIFGRDVQKNEITDVFLIDRSFQIEDCSETKTSKVLNTDQYIISNSHRSMNLLIPDKESEKFKDALLEIESSVKQNQLQNSDRDIFAVPQKEQKCRWFIQGRDYFYYLSHIIEKAEYEIYITDWWFSPEIFLRRGNKDRGDEFRLHDMLMKKAHQGVQIYILIFGNLGADQLNLGAYGLRDRYNNCNNIQIMIHGAGIDKMCLWSHHEKIVVVDQVVAFVGGIDLCAGRFDDEKYHLFDVEQSVLNSRKRNKSRSFDKRNSTISDFDAEIGEMWHGEEGYLWPGKDYINSFKKEFSNPADFMSDILDRKFENRLPWQDISSVVYGNAAFDVARHFIQRWNFTKKESKHDDHDDEYRLLKFILPIPDSVLRERIGELDGSWYSPSPEPGRPYLRPDPYVGTVQTLRSLTHWSGGIKQTENSIYKQYIHLIENAKDFIYIENQFFVTSVNEANESEYRTQNAIGHALVSRIMKAHLKKEKFKVYIIIPLLPEGPCNPQKMNLDTEMLSHKAIMHLQYTSIQRDCKNTLSEYQKHTHTSIFTKLKSLDPNINPEDFIHFGALRKWALKTKGKPVTEVIYVHSKLLIVDDEHVIIGSANVNDRSQLGSRDSEVCLHFNCKDFAQDLREQLWSNFAGESMKSGEFHPKYDSTFNFWKSRAKNNTEHFDDAFRPAPSNKIKNYKQLIDYHRDWIPGVEHDIVEAIEVLGNIKGVLVDFPTTFLEEENFSQKNLPTLTKEFAAPYNTFN